MSEKPIALRESIRAGNFEIRIVRSLEQAETDAARMLRLKTRLMAAGHPDHKIDRWLKRMVWGRSTTHKAPMAPEPGWVDDHEARRWNLHQHRTLVLRREARWKHLAYGFLRGIPYRDMEHMAYTPPPWQIHRMELGSDGKRRWRGTYELDPLQAIVVKYKPDDIEAQTVLQQYAEWIAEAGAWIHPYADSGE